MGFKLSLSSTLAILGALPGTNRQSDERTGPHAVIDESYKPTEIERAAQSYWDEKQTFEVSEDTRREKFYCLSMFPYPSGRLHMGHVRNYTIGDVIARYQRMLGKNVLQPMGWDAFGLPAENAAIQNRVPPAQWTRQNIAYMKRQLKSLGFGYDWHREFATCDSDYYRWEQWLFTRLFERGLAYRKNAVVNWDPVDQTVLANEQVVDGRGWRSGAPVERREIPQWFLKITDYADELLEQLDEMAGWPEHVVTMQRNWIGRSVGVEIDFPVENRREPLTIFTTRPDTLFGVTYMAVAAEHPLAADRARVDPVISAFIEECSHRGATEAEMETLEKKGLPLNIFATHPLTGEAIPIWVANFVLMSYGTGAVMAVPGHDQRDWEFAHAHGLPIKQVIAPWGNADECDITQGAFTVKGVLIESKEFSGMSFDQALAAIADRLEGRGRGRRRVHYRLRDWGVSRQRYWGAPIPMIYTGDGAVAPSPDLPVELPEDVAFEGVRSPLQDMPSFLETEDPRNGQPARRETDTFDTFMESSWYYARFCCPDNDAAMLDERARYWLPVDQYVGGVEHAVLHLLYARFFHKLMRDEGLVESDEPFSNLLTQGMVNAQTYFRDVDGRRVWISPKDVVVETDGDGKAVGAVHRSDGQPVSIGAVEKMSKSKNNGVDPQDMIDAYGADTVRLYMMFTAPPDQALVWNDSAVAGAERFLSRLWSFAARHINTGSTSSTVVGELNAAQRDLRRKVHETIDKVTDDIDRRRTFNTAIAAVMELLNAVSRFDDGSERGLAVAREALEVIVLLLAPIVPHVSHALWSALGHETPVVDASWPKCDPAAMIKDEIMLVVQVNGKVRARMPVPAEADKIRLEELALAEPNVQRFIGEQAIRKIVVVPGKLVNVVC